MALHGGPGSASRDSHKARFDPTRQRVIFHDQRGCGRSTPYGSLEANTTQHLIEDITLRADKLDIRKFILNGGSWGACLSLAYAVEHPDRVAAMVLQGIFTGSQREIDWLDKGMFRIFHPEAWQRYLQATPEAHHDDPSAHHFARILGDDPQAASASGHAYESLEGAVMNLDDRFKADPTEGFDPAGIRTEVHYMRNHCFLPDRHIMQNAHKLTMPVWLVQGRYDMVCPPATAYDLVQALPEGEVIWTIDGHHAGHESWNAIRTILLQLTINHDRTGA